jgi:hypothetical protein
MSGGLDHQSHGGEHGIVLARSALNGVNRPRFLVPEPLP